MPEGLTLGQLPPSPHRFLVDQLTLFSQGGADYAHPITTCPSRVLDDAPPLQYMLWKMTSKPTYYVLYI